MVDEVCLSDVLLAGAKQVFETMIFMDIEKSSDPDQQIEGSSLLGSITFKGVLEGGLAICCDVSCAKTIAQNMLGMEPSEEISDEEVCDAIGEVANMVMGSVKERLADSVGNLEVSIPLVVRGRQLVNNLGEGAGKILIEANVQDEYAVELSLLYREQSD